MPRQHLASGTRALAHALALLQAASSPHWLLKSIALSLDKPQRQHSHGFLQDGRAAAPETGPFLTDTNPHDIIRWTALQTARATPSQPHGSLPTRRGRTAHRHIKNAVSRVAADAPRQRTPHR